uniref:hypothetical protein n=1 Tax=Cupriavidus taiwanensis TaxID=164546 RepID=UPI0011C05B1C|nr:hypothetical protein [Cupriavidus taiwanensis]
MQISRSDLPTITANALAIAIRAEGDSLDYTASVESITRYLEYRTKHKVTLTALVLAMILAGYIAAPKGKTIRFLPSELITNAS